MTKIINLKTIRLEGYKDVKGFHRGIENLKGEAARLNLKGFKGLEYFVETLDEEAILKCK